MATHTAARASLLDMLPGTPRPVVNITAGAAARRTMASMLVRGCGITDILERVFESCGCAVERLQAAQTLDWLLAELGPRPRAEGGAGKTPRTMLRTRRFTAGLISRLTREAAYSALPIPAAAPVRGANTGRHRPMGLVSGLPAVRAR